MYKRQRQRFVRAKEVFLRLLEQPLDRRADVLAEACGSDLPLRDEVESLLAAHREHATGSLLAVSGRLAEWDDADVSALPEIDGYRLIRHIGEGGMGDVFLAEQLEPFERTVAIKLIKPGMDSRAVVKRFHKERQALARMRHDNIAVVFDAGVTRRGQPYFSMEHVPGEPITVFCERRRLTLRERLRLFVEVCQGIQHAHEKGVLHCDIKPSNVLVAGEVGRRERGDVETGQSLPLSALSTCPRPHEPRPKIIDFGIARALHRHVLGGETLTHPVGPVGTPRYMSPEQAISDSGEVDTRSDVYSLGVMLYELLVGGLFYTSRCV